MPAFIIRYSRGPLEGRFPEKELRISPGYRMSFGHGKERTLRLPKESEVAEEHAAIKNVGTASKPQLHLVPGKGKTRVWVPGTQYYEQLSAPGMPLTAGMRIRMGQHEFQVQEKPSENPRAQPSKKAAAPVHPIVQELMYIHRFMKQLAKSKPGAPSAAIPKAQRRNSLQIVIPESRLNKITTMLDREKITYRHQSVPTAHENSRHYRAIWVDAGNRQNKKFISAVEEHRGKFK